MDHLESRARAKATATAEKAAREVAATLRAREGGACTTSYPPQCRRSTNSAFELDVLAVCESERITKVTGTMKGDAVCTVMFAQNLKCPSSSAC